MRAWNRSPRLLILRSALLRASRRMKATVPAARERLARAV
jgi:hypothetical protein